MRVLYTLHIMWYESKIINETLDSLQMAINHSDVQVDILICLNSQTYVETPDNGVEPDKLFYEFLNHELLKNANIIYKNDDDDFYNIGDWRRDIYGDNYDYNYIVWGESDCLVPKDYFDIMKKAGINHPHILSLANRKMWDSTWDEIEHDWIKQFPRNGPPDRPEQAPKPFNCADYITLQELNDFNDKFSPTIKKTRRIKIDGNMTALSPGLPYPYLPLDLHFAREDYCLQLFFEKKSIPQYIISTRLKGHNQCHPNKRIGTSNKKDDTVYQKYEKEAYESIMRFLR